MSHLTEMEKARIRRLWLADEPVPVICERLGRDGNCIRAFARADPACADHERPKPTPSSLGGFRQQRLRRRS